MTTRNIEYQYSNDNINWHDVFLDTDYYRRERIVEIDASGTTTPGAWTVGTLFVRDGYTPRLGVDFENGSFVSLVYKNASAKPIDPVGGSYDGDNQVVPTGWEISPSTTLGSDVTWVSKTVYNMIAGVWTADAWSIAVQFTGKGGTSPVKGTDFFDGVDGGFVSIIFHVSANKPARPTGGSFDGNPLNEVIPADWTDDPNTPGVHEYSWMSKNKYAKDASTGQWINSIWSSPVRYSGAQGDAPKLGVDYFSPSGGKFTSYIFKVAAVRPPKPTTGTFNGVDEIVPTGWTNDASNPSANTYIWMCSRIYTDTGAALWDDSTWSEAVQFSGDDGYTPQRGVDFLDGENGVFTSYVFRNAAGTPPAPTGGSFDGTNEVTPTGWADDPTSPSAGNQTFVAKTKYRFTADGVSPGSGVWVNDSWSIPSQFSGTPGPLPVPGVDYFPVDGSFVTFIYKSVVKGSTPAGPTGGSYNGSAETTPTGWTDSPSIPADGYVMWVSTNKYEHNGTVWAQAGTWSAPAHWYNKPVQGVDYFTKDGSYVSFQFINVAPGTTPSTPTGGTFNGTGESASTGWSLDPIQTLNEEVTWVSKTTYSDDNPASATSNWAKTGWSTPAKFYEKGTNGTDGTDGLNGAAGVNGGAGPRGSKRYYGTTTGTAWSNAVANGVITTAGDTKVGNDVVTLSRAAIGYSETRFWHVASSSWKVIHEVIDGNLLVDGTIIAGKIAANAVTGTNISATTTIIAGSGGNTAGMNGANLGVYSGWRFWAGNATPNLAPYKVNSSGKLFATGAEISGKLTIGTTGTEVTDTAFKNSNTTQNDVGLSNVNNTSDATVLAAASAAAQAKDNLVTVTANAYADGIVTIEETRAIADASAKANAAVDAARAAAELVEANLMPIEYTNIHTAKPPAITTGGNAGATFGWAANPLVGNPLGVGALLINNTNANSESFVYFGRSSDDYNINIKPRSRQIVSCYVLSGSTGTNMQMYLRTGDGVHKGASITTGNINTWQRVSVVLDLTGNSSRDAILRIDNDSPGNTLYVSRIMVEVKPIGGTNEPSPYIEGVGGIVDKKAGTVAGWNIDTTDIYSGSDKTIAADGYKATGGIRMNSNGYIKTKEFQLNTDGSAKFKGKLEAASGSFGSANEIKIQPNAISVFNTDRTFSVSIDGGVYGTDSLIAGMAVAGYASKLGGIGGYFESNVGVGMFAHAYTQPAGWFVNGNNEVVVKVAESLVGVRSSGVSYDFYAAGAGVNYAPFTGSHEGLIPKHTPLEVGDIVCDVDLINITNVSNALCLMGSSTKSAQKSARGIYVQRSSVKSDEVIGLPNDFNQEGDYDLIAFNSLGEGAMNVCGEGGDLEIGDLIMSSNMPGKGMLQPDGIVQNITVAEVRQNVKFTSPTDVQMVAVIYRCG